MLFIAVHVATPWISKNGFNWILLTIILFKRINMARIFYVDENGVIKIIIIYIICFNLILTYDTG